MNALAVLQALGRPVVLLSSPLDFLDAGLTLAAGPHGLWAVALPNRSQIHADPWSATIFLPSGARLLARHHDDGPWALAVVDDAREAEGVGARVLVAMGLRVAGEERR